MITVLKVKIMGSSLSSQNVDAPIIFFLSTKNVCFCLGDPRKDNNFTRTAFALWVYDWKP